jgi:hypothetical protein
LGESMGLALLADAEPKRSQDGMSFRHDS